jgi:hypothetical protein
MYRKNPTLLTFNVSDYVLHGCAADEEIPLVSVCAFQLHGDYLNVGHSGQVLYRCWSWFRTMRTAKRQLLELSRPASHWPGLNARPWQADLIASMNATYTRKMPSACVAVWKLRSSATPHDPFLYPGFTEAFFTCPEAAWELASAVTKQSPGYRSRAVHLNVRVGILNRLGGKRPWIHSEAFIALVRREHPEVSIDEWTMDNLTLAEQVKAIRSHDIIISPHGAQNSNFAFAVPCTVLLELFPAQYFLPMYLDLAGEVGARTFYMYPGTRERAVRETMAHTAASFSRQRVLRHQRVTTPAEEVLGALRTLIREFRTCVRHGRYLELPQGFDNVPTLGGFQWLSLNSSHVRGRYSGTDVGATMRSTCLFCNATAGCCAQGVTVDLRRVFFCRACY